MIDGAKKFIDVGYKIEKPKAVKDAIEEYRQGNDWLNDFVTECCEVDADNKEGASSLYEGYRGYSEGLNEYTRHVSDFKAAMTAAGFTWKKTNKGAFYFGLRLKDDGFVPYRRSSVFDNEETAKAS